MCYILKVINFASFVNTDIYVEIYAMILLYLRVLLTITFMACDVQVCGITTTIVLLHN